MSPPPKTDRAVATFLARCQAYFAAPSEYPDLPDDPLGVLEFAEERDRQLYAFLWEHRDVMRRLGEPEHASEVSAFLGEIDRRNREWTEHFKREDLYRSDVDTDLAVVLMSGGWNELTKRILAYPGGTPPIDTWIRFAREAYARAFGTRRLVDALDHRT